jgi:SAM-dependent methyltransferase
MAQVATGVRHVLSRPSVYDFFQNLVGVTASRDRWTREFVQPFAGARILDIGCGTGEIRRHLPDAIDYLGFDLSEAYIASARRRYGPLGRFECRRVEDFAKPDGNAGNREKPGTYDIALAFGVLHHLDDPEAGQVFQCARRALKPTGRLVTIDPAFVPNQSALSHYVVSRDRGRNVRFPEAFAALGKPWFSRVSITVWKGVLRIPSDHAILVCEP